MSRCDGVVVVLDGLDRLRWRRTAVDRWTPCGLWPSDDEAAEVGEVLDRRQPLLVVLDRCSDPVYVFVDELASAPPAVMALVSAVDDDVAELRAPQLDWLPGPLCQRGRNFLRRVLHNGARLPALLTPPLVLDEDGHDDNVRFGVRTRSVDWRPSELAAAVTHTFAAALAVSARVS